MALVEKVFRDTFNNEGYECSLNSAENDDDTLIIGDSQGLCIWQITDTCEGAKPQYIVQREIYNHNYPDDVDIEAVNALPLNSIGEAILLAVATEAKLRAEVFFTVD